MESFRLPLGVGLLLKSRDSIRLVTLCVALELSLPFWAGGAFVVTHNGYFAEIPFAVSIQAAVVLVLLYTTSSAFHSLDRLAAIKLWRYGLGLDLIQVLLVGGASTGASAVIGDVGTLGWAAPTLAFVGMYGIGMTATGFVDRRIAGLFSLVPLVAPLALNTTRLPAHQAWSFIADGSAPDSAWIPPVLWLAVGLVSRGFAFFRVH